MTRLGTSILIALLAGGGCSSDTSNTDYDLVFTDVRPIDYAHIQCRLVPMEHRHTCLTKVIEHYHYVIDEGLDADDTTGGPIIGVLLDDIYRGSYVSQPFAAAFTVSNGRNVCRGRYNAFFGDTEAIFHVRCDNGATGMANLILDASGRNGIGIAWMDDGTRGDIIFGDAAVADIVF